MKQEIIQKEKLPEGWKIKRFGELVSMKKGKKQEPIFNKNVPGSVAHILVESFNGNYKKYTTSKKGQLCTKEDILIIWDGSRFGLTSTDLEGYVGSTLGIISSNGEIIKDYLSYFLKYNYNKIRERKKGSGIPHLDKDYLYNFKVTYPVSKDIQKNIVNKINAQMTQLEIMKNGVEKEKESINDLFQSFLNKEIFDKKESFKKYLIGDLCDLMTGGTPSKAVKSFWERGDINWLSSGEVNKEFIYDVDGRITKEGLDSSNARMLPINSIMIALNGQGKTRGTVAVLKNESTCNQSLVGIIPKNKEELDYMFLFYYLKGSYQRLRNMTGDNERSGLSMTILNKFEISAPAIEEQRRIVKKIEKFRAQFLTLDEEINNKLAVIDQLPEALLNEVFGKYEVEK